MTSWCEVSQGRYQRGTQDGQSSVSDSRVMLLDGSGWTKIRAIHKTLREFVQGSRDLMATRVAAANTKDDEDVISTSTVKKQEWSRQLRAKCSQDSPSTISPEAFYRQTAEAGMRYGPACRLIAELSSGPASAVGLVKAAETSSQMPVSRRDAVLSPSAFTADVICRMHSKQGAPPRRLRLIARECSLNLLTL